MTTKTVLTDEEGYRQARNRQRCAPYVKDAFENGKAIGREEREQESSAMLAQTVMLEGDKTKDDRIKALEAEVSKAKEKYFIERDERLKLEADKEIQATELRGKINEISVLSAKIRKLRRQPRSKKEGK